MNIPLRYEVLKIVSFALAENPKTGDSASALLEKNQQAKMHLIAYGELTKFSQAIDLSLLIQDVNND